MITVDFLQLNHILSLDYKVRGCATEPVVVLFILMEQQLHFEVKTSFKKKIFLASKCNIATELLDMYSLLQVKSFCTKIKEMYYSPVTCSVHYILMLILQDFCCIPFRA